MFEKNKQKRNQMTKVFYVSFVSLCWLVNTPWLSGEKPHIKIVCTAATSTNYSRTDQFNSRKQEYIHAIKTVQSYGYNPYIFDVSSKRSFSFFESYTSPDRVFYPLVDDNNYRNKGVNEAVSLLAGFRHFKFNDNDMIIKMVGRYYFNSDAFVRLVEANPDVDVFVKFDSYGQAFTGCYAMRFRYSKELHEKLDLDLMEKNMINIEAETGRYIKELERRGVKVMYLNKLDVTANIFGHGVRDFTQ